MKFSDLIVFETDIVTLRIGLNNTKIDRLGECDNNFSLTPELIDIEASLSGQIVSFARFKGLGSMSPMSGLTKFPDWSEQELVQPSAEQSNQLRSELRKLLGGDDFELRGDRLNKAYSRVEFLRVLAGWSQKFKQQLQLVIERNAPDDINLTEILPSLYLAGQHGEAIPYFGGPDPWDEEYWLRNDEADLHCYYDLIADNDLHIEVCVRPKHPVGRIPIDNVFDISITRASAEIKLSDYTKIKELLVPMITALSLRSPVNPRIDTQNFILAVTTGGDHEGFAKNHTLEEKLSALVDANEKDGEDGNNHNEALYLAARNFLMSFETLHHLWSSPSQISMLDRFNEPSGFHCVNKLVAFEFSSSLASRLSKAFHIAIILAFQQQNGRMLFVGATSEYEDLSGEHLVRWDWSESLDQFGESDLFRDKINRDTFGKFRSQLIRDGLFQQ